jgi:hypothetical protein
MQRKMHCQETSQQNCGTCWDNRDLISRVFPRLLLSKKSFCEDYTPWGTNRLPPFQEFWNQPLEQAEGFLKKWYFWATHSRIEPIKEAAYTIKRHWDGVMNWFKSRINNGILEGINSMIQASKARARGYRTIDYLITMIYLLNGKLKFNLPT